MKDAIGYLSHCQKNLSAITYEIFILKPFQFAFLISHILSQKTSMNMAKVLCLSLGQTR
jgi:hypothetical protein